MEQVIVLQRTVISLLLLVPPARSNTFPRLSELIRSSINARSGSVDALNQQYQRMLQVAPLVEMPRAATSCPPRQTGNDFPYSCISCSWKSDELPRYTVLEFDYGYNNIAEVRADLFYFYAHLANFPRRYKCLVYGENEGIGFSQTALKLHLKCTPDHFWKSVYEVYMPLCGNILK
jgi:hypothetical protein